MVLYVSVEGMAHKSFESMLPRMSGNRFGWGESEFNFAEKVQLCISQTMYTVARPVVKWIKDDAHLDGTAVDSDMMNPLQWTPVRPWYDCDCSCIRCLSISLKRNHISK